MTIHEDLKVIAYHANQAVNAGHALSYIIEQIKSTIQSHMLKVRFNELKLSICSLNLPVKQTPSTPFFWEILTLQNNGTKLSQQHFFQICALHGIECQEFNKDANLRHLVIATIIMGASRLVSHCRTLITVGCMPPHELDRNALVQRIAFLEQSLVDQRTFYEDQFAQLHGMMAAQRTDNNQLSSEIEKLRSANIYIRYELVKATENKNNDIITTLSEIGRGATNITRLRDQIKQLISSGKSNEQHTVTRLKTQIWDKQRCGKQGACPSVPPDRLTIFPYLDTDKASFDLIIEEIKDFLSLRAQDRFLGQLMAFALMSCGKKIRPTDGSIVNAEEPMRKLAESQTWSEVQGLDMTSAILVSSPDSRAPALGGQFGVFSQSQDDQKSDTRDLIDLLPAGLLS